MARGSEEHKEVRQLAVSEICSRPQIKCAGHVACMGEERGAYRVLVGKPEGKRQLGRPKRRWVDNNRMDLQEVGCGYVDWIGLAQDQTQYNFILFIIVPGL